MGSTGAGGGWGGGTQAVSTPEGPHNVPVGPPAAFKQGVSVHPRGERSPWCLATPPGGIWPGGRTPFRHFGGSDGLQTHPFAPHHPSGPPLQPRPSLVPVCLLVIVHSDHRAGDK